MMPPHKISVRAGGLEVVCPGPNEYMLYTLELSHHHKQQQQQEEEGGHITTELIAMRWSAVLKLRSGLASTSIIDAAAAGLIQGIMDRTRTSGWRGLLRVKGKSCVDMAVAEKRLADIQLYLQSVLDDPKLRQSDHVKAFLDDGRRCALEVHGAIITPPLQDEEEKHTSDITKKSSLHMQSKQDAPSVLETASLPQEEIAPYQPNNKQIKQLRFSGRDRKTFKQSMVSVGHSWPWQRRILPQQADERTMRAFKILLFDSRMLAPFLQTQDLNHLSRTCKEMKGAERQIRSLTSCANPLIELQYMGRHLAQATIAVLHRMRQGRASADWRSLSARTLKEHKENVDRRDEDWAPLLAALREGKTRDIERLNLARRDMHPQLSSSSFCRMASYFHQMPHLVSLNLVAHRIGSKGAVALAEGLRHMPHLETLNISQTHIGDEGATAIAAALPYLPKLKRLLLGSCAIGDEGGKALSNHLKYIPNLRCLSYGRNFPSNGGIHFIIENLPSLPELRVIHFEGMQLQDQGASHLASKLHHLPKLRSLTVSCSGICDVGIRILMQPLAKLKQLKALEVGRNYYSQEVSEELRGAMEARGIPFYDTSPGYPKYRSFGCFRVPGYVQQRPVYYGSRVGVEEEEERLDREEDQEAGEQEEEEEEEEEEEMNDTQ